MSTTRAGSLYWMAPELLHPERFGLKFSRTPATDIYALGCVCIELYTGRPPFSNLSEPAALMKVRSGTRPERPPGPPTMSDMLWECAMECWAENPITRPSSTLLVKSRAWPTPRSQPSPSVLPDMCSLPLPQLTSTVCPPALTPPATNKSLLSAAASTTTPGHEASIPSYVDIDGSCTPFLDLAGETLSDTKSRATNLENELLENGLLMKPWPEDGMMTIPHSTRRRPSLDRGIRGGQEVDRHDALIDINGSSLDNSDIYGRGGKVPLSRSPSPVHVSVENFAPQFRAKLESPLTPSSSNGPSPAERQDSKQTYKPILGPSKPIMGASPRSKKSKWWPAKTLNAFTNILPSQIASGRVSPAAGLQHMKEQYEVMYDYSAAPHDPHEISFRQGDIVDFISKEDSDYWWVRKANGSVGIAPSRCLRSSGSSASTHSCRYETQNPESSVENFVMSPTPTAGAADGEHWDSCQYRAIAAYTYNRSAPNEISFGRGEKLDVLGKCGRSCRAKKAKDGSVGIAPCNYLRIIPATNPGNEDEGRYKYKAKARWAYNSSAHGPNELSFSQGEVLDVVNKQGDWWQAKTADGRIGIAPSHYLQIELP